MSISRRSFVRGAGIGAAGALAGSFIGDRGREAREWGPFDATVSADEGAIILSSNENPLGPAPSVLEAVRTGLGETGEGAARYPNLAGDLKTLVAKSVGARTASILPTCGSVQALRLATQAYTSSTKPLVTPSPTYEACANYAEAIGSAVKRVPLDSRLQLDLEAMAAAAKGAGLVFLCNPNNPTGLVHPDAAVTGFIERVLRTSPQTTILVDEAYHHYVVDPAYKTQVAAALANPRVIVARTFSKVYGMAGLRCGVAIAHPETIKELTEWDNFGIAGRLNYFALKGAIAAMQLDAATLKKEIARNREALDFTRAFFKKEGYTDTDTQANCVFVDLRKPAQKFAEACRDGGVLVGRPFPPLDNYTRISIGTLEEMRKATAVFQKVLGAA